MTSEYPLPTVPMGVDGRETRAALAMQSLLFVECWSVKVSSRRKPR